MKIECKIKRQGGSIVDMPNGEGQPDTRYHFKPIDPTRPDSPHVAEVGAAHAERFFQADARVYVPFGEVTVDIGAAPARPTRQPPTPHDLANRGAQGEGVQIQTEAASKAGDDNGDGVLSVRELKAAIQSGTYTPEQLRELMAAEEASAEPRQSFIDVIVKALKS